MGFISERVVWAPALLLVACSGENSKPPANDGSDLDGFEALFNGMDLTGITAVGLDPSTLSVEAGVLECSGLPFGYWYAPGTYRNFILRLEYRFERPLDLADGADDTYPGNSGYFVYLTPPHRAPPEGWPLALEVQGSHDGFGGVYTLPEFVAVSPVDMAALQAAKRPVGAWNEVEIRSDEGEVGVTLNGYVLTTSTPTALREGLIGFESEGAEVHWRNLRVKRLP